MTIFPDGQRKVELLDIYRGRHLERYPLFFATDSELKKIASTKSPEQAEAEIFTIVMGRLQKSFPVLAQRVLSTAALLPFHQWVRSASSFPLVDDYVDLNDLQEGEQQVQIAYRRANQIIYNEDLYVAMDGLNRAALRLHEYLYAISSLKMSVKIQRLVSLIFSTWHDGLDLAKQGRVLLSELKMETLAMANFELPSGAQVDQSGPGPDEICGVWQTMEFDKTSMGLKVTVALDPHRRSLTRSDFAGLKSTSFSDSRFSERRTVILNGNELKRFLLSFYYAKSFLEKKFPIFLYPAQSVPADIICLDAKGIRSLEASLEYDKDGNDHDLEGARLEAEYFRAQYDYLKQSGPDELIKFKEIEAELGKHQLKSTLIKADPWRVFSARELGGFRIQFNP